MKIHLSLQIKKREFGKHLQEQDLEVLKRACRSAQSIPLAARNLPPGTRIIKTYATSTHGPKRIVFLLIVDGGDLFLLFYRGKNDALGRNISTDNPQFTTSLRKHLCLLEEDILAGKIETLEF